MRSTVFRPIWQVQPPRDDNAADPLAPVPAVRTGSLVGYAAHHAPEVLDEHFLVDGRGRFRPRTERDGRPPSRMRIEAARASRPFP
ncbi:hypothetical protein ABZT28_39980 [Streptomyces sp. NPDC005388]|uniref:hypothetical protein n=1 Tax=Streptomyces sp. NPDC005388 TaxID=3156717 RepID=UPI0033A72B82